MAVFTQNDIHMGNFSARYKMKVGLGNFTYRKLVYLGCLQVIFLEKSLKNVQDPFRSVLSRYQNGSSQDIPLTCLYKRKLETSVDFHQQTPSGRKPISSPQWQLPFEGLGVFNKHLIWSLFAKAWLDFQVYFLKPLHYFSLLMPKN